MLTSVKAPKKHEAHTSNGVVVKGVDDVLVTGPLVMPLATSWLVALAPATVSGDLAGE